MTTATKAAPKAIKATITAPTNPIAQNICGPNGIHLDILQEELGIEINNIGNQFHLSGPEAALEKAKAVFAQLLEIAKRSDLEAGDIIARARHNGVSAQFNFFQTPRKRIVARTPNQSEYIGAIKENDIVFGIGPAGTGKTYLAVAFAAVALDKGLCERIILARPAVEAGERLGFLPGDAKDKVDPYMRPLYDALYDVMPPERVETLLETKVIEIAPIAFMRGRTFINTVVVLDEAQNTTPMQMKMVLTRLGEGSKMLINGDPTQIDLPAGQKSGLVDGLEKVEGIRGIANVRFTAADVVRRDLVARIVEAYEARAKSPALRPA